MANEIPYIIFGRLTKDPEVRYVSNNLAVVSLSIASNSRKFDRNTQEWSDEPAVFMRASAWREFAENIANSCSKGMEVVGYGYLKNKPYEKDGATRDSLEIELQNFGPDLRRATAQVTRVQTNQNQTRNREQYPQGGQATPQAQTPPPRTQQAAPVQHAGQTGQEKWADETPAAGGSQYEDETPW